MVAQSSWTSWATGMADFIAACSLVSDAYLSVTPVDDVRLGVRHAAGIGGPVGVTSHLFHRNNPRTLAPLGIGKGLLAAFRR